MIKLAILIIVMIFVPVWAIAAQPNITNLTPIPLHSGVNVIPRFGPDGSLGMIVLGWRDNGNAHGFDMALVMTESGKNGPWNVARVEGLPNDPNDDGSDVVEDDPHTGDDMVEAFRFAKGNVDGIPSTLLLTATRDMGDSIPDPSLVTFDAYQLVYDPDVGTTENHFAPILSDRSAGDYCNADTALSFRFNLPIRASNQAPRTPNGC